MSLEQPMPNVVEKDEEVVESEISAEDIQKEKERAQGVIREYMSDGVNGRIAAIKEAIKTGDKMAAEKIKEEALDDLKSQITFVESMENPELDEMKNKLQSVVEYYEQKF